jgi:hypothetical protein
VLFARKSARLLRRLVSFSLPLSSCPVTLGETL